MARGIPFACFQIFFTAPDRFLSAVDVQNGKTVWRNNNWKFRETVGISNDGEVVFARSMTDSVIAVRSRSQNFNPVWQADFKYTS